ncbi:MAG: 1-acyl-sn-glycerol-3-phosphate acyltransferase [Betaproteobacteria bacterium]|nr:1-acyl-sn-glycerol-3-phosphate acyltransferase [Betaproteobacteria bacterium]
MIFIRSVLFFVLGVVNTIFFGCFVLPLSFIKFEWGYDTARGWGVVTLWLAKHVCGIDYVVNGRENIPDHPCVSMAKHQSAWETVFILINLPRAVWIIKKELVWLPIIGWVLYALKSIAIDRKSGKRAVDQIEEQGRNRIAQGLWISIFPEGTRVAPGKRGRYGIGGALLAARTGTPVLPLAHNAGECWRRNAFLKYPGKVTVSIGPVIQTAGREPGDVIADVENWIEGEMAKLPPANSWRASGQVNQ